MAVSPAVPYAREQLTSALDPVTIHDETVEVASAHNLQRGKSIFPQGQVDAGKHVADGLLDLRIVAHQQAINAHIYIVCGLFQ
jgi:hypothetical protein